MNQSLFPGKIKTILNLGIGFEIIHSLERFEVFTAATMKNAVFCDVTPCGSYKNRVSEELSASIIRLRRIGEVGTTLAVTNNQCTL
jgi:hypothetical protein